MSVDPSPQPVVRRRRVFYIPGYDPFPPRRYRELYRAESAAQAAVSGYQITMAGRTGRHGWQVRAQQDGQHTETWIEVLLWSDIVRESMGGSVAATYGQLLRTAWIYLSTGALWRLARLRKGPVIAALYPVLVLILQAVVAVLAGWVAGAGLCMATGLSGALALGAQGLVTAAVAWAVLRWFRRHDNRVFAWYLMHDYAFSALGRGAEPPQMRDRIAGFTDRIAAALRDDVDEVLVVGHSSGAHIAVQALAGLLRAERGERAVLSLLTLGQVVPMVTALPRAQALREDLRFLSQRDDLFWLDVTAPGDGCAFALCDPVAVSGAATPGQRWPLVISAAFTQTLSPERWRQLKRRYFRLHFQYLCAFDRPGDYDYFRITAGPQTLAARFGGRGPSPGRITRDITGARP